MAIRIVGGSLRGRVLSVAAGKLTRPTAQKVRGALFDILGNITGFRCLDLYAGSGALGIEALSRGAAHATFVESARAACGCLHENLAELKLASRAEVLALPVERVARKLAERGPFDLILCDPPWAHAARAAGALERILKHGTLSASGLVVFEHAAHDPIELVLATGLTLRERRVWGDSAAAIYGLASDEHQGARGPSHE